MKKLCAYWFSAYHKESGDDETLSLTILADSETIARKELNECGYFAIVFLGTAAIYQVENPKT